jgi:flagellar biosynthetic protein FlhB
MISALVLTVFAVIDFAFQRWQFSRNLRMTKQEVREEYKEVEGSPMIKARMKSIQREMARRRMMQEVPRADVVITNPTHFAVALKYDFRKGGAPRVVAKGANIIAEKIKEIARQSGVPVFEDKPLARALFALDVNQEISEVFYKAVAAILAQVYRMKGKGITG